ncbi:hypothetical protein J2R99_000333 [Rhodopseudomonas julia]|uniref:Uncharacterized protein n=1 Tax=Rhodopseudomonas julia TaxID=200617 RepID=A0ABU0C1U9_9BRAD|nr:hypothetical protein [Rhodopseudomonas julia]MDQ0324484.1 hypothetical protein [Rhodopseudomonas julia]
MKPAAAATFLSLSVAMFPAWAAAQSNLSGAHEVGELTSVQATLEDTPDSSPATLRVRGLITAPEPCQVATAEAVGEGESETAGIARVLKIRVTTARASEDQACTQKLTDLQFQFTQEVGLREFEEVEVISDRDIERALVELAE